VLHALSFLFTLLLRKEPIHRAMQSSIFLCLSQARINWEGYDRKGIRHKNGGIDGGGLLISLDGVAPILIINLPSTIKSRRSFLLALTHLGGPGKRKGCKIVVVLLRNDSHLV